MGELFFQTDVNFRAVASDGEHSSWTTSDTSVSSANPIPLPSGVTVSETSPGSSIFTITWSGQAGYTLGAVAAFGPTAYGFYGLGSLSSGGSFTTPSVNAGDFIAVGIVNTSDAGSDDLAVTSTVPFAPASISAKPVSASAININWTDSSRDETSFDLQRSTTADFSSDVTDLKTGSLGTDPISADTTSYSDTGLTPGTYYYRVAAVKDGDSTGWATTSATTISSSVPTFSLAASASSVNQGGTFGLELSWTGTITYPTMVPIQFGGSDDDVAAEGVDFTTAAPSEVLIPAGATDPMYFSVTATNNGLPGWTKVINAYIPDSTSSPMTYIASSSSTIDVAIDNVNLGITLGDGSSDQILFGDGTGLDDLTKLVINTPNYALTGSTVELSATDNADIAVFKTDDPTSLSQSIISSTSSSYMWTRLCLKTSF